MLIGKLKACRGGVYHIVVSCRDSANGYLDGNCQGFFSVDVAGYVIGTYMFKRQRYT